MRKVVIATAATLILAAIASPAWAGQQNQHCDLDDGLQVQNASNNGHDANYAEQHIWQHQGGATFGIWGALQHQKAENSKDDSSGGSQKISQKQFGIVLFGKGCPVQDSHASNWTGKYADDNDQSIKQKQKAFIGYADGTAQNQDADNKVTGYGDGNTQKTSQSQTLAAGSTHGTVQTQDAENKVDDGDGNTQTINQSQSLVLLGGSH